MNKRLIPKYQSMTTSEYVFGKEQQATHMAARNFPEILIADATI